MTEWGVITVIAALVALGAAICGPIIKLNTSIARLTTTMENVAERLDRLDEDNHNSHKRLWEHNDQQDDQLAGHETRIALLEHTKEEKQR